MHEKSHESLINVIHKYLYLTGSDHRTCCPVLSLLSSSIFQCKETTPFRALTVFHSATAKTEEWHFEERGRREEVRERKRRGQERHDFRQTGKRRERERLNSDRGLLLSPFSLFSIGSFLHYWPLFFYLFSDHCINFSAINN